MTIRRAPVDDQDVATIRELFWEYLQWANARGNEAFNVDFDIASMLEDDMAHLDRYAPPAGRLLLAFDGERPIGIGCLRTIGPDMTEIKRMYVRPETRGSGRGRMLLDALLGEARAAGSATVRLDSAGYMEAAHALYRSAGFVDIDAYPESEISEEFRPHWVFMEMQLSAPLR